jgi:hypothetical protein
MGFCFNSVRFIFFTSLVLVTDDVFGVYEEGTELVGKNWGRAVKK